VKKEEKFVETLKLRSLKRDLLSEIAETIE
jgi:hypothetical protein